MISSSDLLFIGITEAFTATVTMSDGSTKPVTGGAWGGDNPGVATVAQASGQVTIVGSGMVTIYVDYQGLRGTIQIRGLPNFQGTWAGTISIVSCNTKGAIAKTNFCTNFPVNSRFPTNLELTQDRDQVQGRGVLGVTGTDVTGKVQTDGSLALTGIIVEPPGIRLISWILQSTTPGKCIGTLLQLWTVIGLKGDGEVVGNIRKLNRTSSAP